MEWISVKNRLPEGEMISKKVIVAYGVKEKQITFGWYRINEWVTSDMVPFAMQDLITHWMPLPKLPND